MSSYHVRDFFGKPIEYTLTLPPTFQLTFDDGETIETTMEQTHYCRFIWTIAEMFPLLPMKKEFHLLGKRPGKETHCELAAKIAFGAFFHYRDNCGQILDMVEMGRLCYEVTSMLYNFIATDLQPWVASLSFLDFVEILMYPPVHKINEQIQKDPEPTPTKIADAHEAIKNILMKDPVIRRNAIAKAARSGLVSMGQILQCVACRGYLTDVDRWIFPKPIVHGFAHGLTLAESATESRSAAMSHYFAKRPMADSEYLNRVVQQAAQAISRLHHTDCGSPRTVKWTVRDSTDLRDLQGQYYCPDPDNTRVYKPILEGDKSLIGQTLYLRNVTVCAHLDNGGVCQVCYGEIGFSVPPGDNIGHLAATKVQGPLGQSMLSVKHEHQSATSSMLLLSDYDSQFLISKPDDNLYIHARLKGLKPQVILDCNEAFNLYDLQYVKNVRDLSPQRVTQMTKMDFMLDGKMFPVVCSTETRTTNLSREALEYIQRTGWTINGSGNYVVDLSGWDFNKPFMNVPQFQFSAPDHMKMIEAMIKCKSTRNFKTLMDYDTPDARLQAFHDLVALRLSVNIVHLGILIISVMARNPEANDYWTPSPKWEGRPVPFKLIQEKRSLGGAMAYEKQPGIIFDTDAFNIRNRPPHTLDPMLMGH